MDINLKLCEGTRLDEKRAGQICRIYAENFPPLERVPQSYLLESVASGAAFMLTLEEGDVVLGFAFLQWLTDQKMLFLEYLAVDHALQGGGYGGLILKSIIDEAKTRPGILGVILEIESPEDGVKTEKALRQRRVMFYQRYAAELIEDHGAYCMPDITGLGSMPMRLMWIPTQPGASGYPQVNFRNWLIRFFQAAYERGEDDPFLQQILLKLPAG